MPKTLTFKQFVKTLGDLTPLLERTIIKGLRSAAHRGVSTVVESINEPTAMNYAPVDTGQLARSVEASDLPRGGRLSVDAPYAAVMENGARPFRPPLQPLKDWAARKFGADEEEARQIAFAVQEHIATWGFEPRHYFRRAMGKVRKIVKVEVESEMRKQLLHGEKVDTATGELL